MINILFFSYLQDEVGSQSVVLEAEDISVKEIKSIMLEKYEVKKLDGVMVAVNEEYATDETVVKNGDVVAFIPPVSGG